MRRKVLKVVASLAAGYALWLVAAFFVQRRLVFPRHLTRQAAQPGAGLPGLEKRWFVPAAGASHAWRAPAVIFAHGNAELIDGQRAMVHGYHRLGVSVLLCELRGYGRSAGSPSQARITADYVKCVIEGFPVSVAHRL